MLKKVTKKINQSKINLSPFPYLFIKDFINKENLKSVVNSLPSFNEIYGKEIQYQSKSQTKKTVLPSSKIYKKLSKKKSFKDINFLFEKLKPVILKKFRDQIKLHVKANFQNSKLKYHSSFSIMKKGYKKSAHLDRRDHLIHMIFYPDSEASKGGEICINSLKKHSKIFDIFPKVQDLKISKKHKIKNNSCLIILNVPWAYHSVSPYYGKKDRKYFYMVYDFPISKSGSKLKNRKKGFNQNEFWNYKVEVKSIKRKKVFLSE